MVSYTLVPFVIHSGQTFGGDGGSSFQDFSSPCYISGVTIFLGVDFIEGLQFSYLCPSALSNTLTSRLHGSSGSAVRYELQLAGTERINKIQLIVGTDYGETIKSVRFFTTYGRSTQSIDHMGGTIGQDERGGCTLGYITGRAGLFIDQLMFHWYC